MAPSILLPAVGWFLALGLLYVVGVITYRLTLHPLAKYPGPLLGSITDWYIVMRSAKGDRHLDFLRLHDKYGAFVRFGPNRIAVNTAEGLKEIYGVRANTNKSSWYHMFHAVFAGDSSVTTTNQDKHVRKRRVVMDALSEKSIRGMEELMLRNIRRFLKAVGPDETGGWSSPKDMADWCGYLSFDIMGDICFSSSFETLLKKESRFLLDVLPQGVNGLNIVAWMPGILHLGIGNLLFSRLAEDLKRYVDFATKQSNKRLALESEAVLHADVYSHLLAANEKTPLLYTPEDLVGESSLLITAGSDTTSVTMATTLFYLLHNPRSLSRVESEILAANMSDLDATARVGELRYLRACIDEAMRMSPAVPGVLPRVALHGGVSIGGEHFPAGTDLGVSHYALHHNEALFPDSFAYQPERWLPEPMHDHETHEAAEDRLRTAQSAYCPFSVGPRACVGKALAVKEMMVTLARLVSMYEMRLAPGQEMVGTGGGLHAEMGRHRVHEYQMRDMFIAKTKGPVVQFRRRDGHASG